MSASEGSNTGDTRKVVVVIPMPNDPDWTIFEELSEDVPIIVADDSDGKLAPAPRGNVRYFDYTAQREYVGDEHWPAIPHRSAASRNFGHIVAYREGFDVIVALDYDCQLPKGWLAAHLDVLTKVVEAPAMAPVRADGWVNSIQMPGFYSRGYPYEFRNPHDSVETPATATGEIKINMGLWSNIVDLNGIDRFPPHDPSVDPGVPAGGRSIALGNIPVCGMNTSFAAELTPAYFFLPDLWVEDGSPGNWQLSRHDDIWGGYVVKKLMDKRGDLFAFGDPVVTHTRLTPGEKTAKIEHYMHLMARGFFACTDAAMERVEEGEYATMFADFTEEFLVEAGRSPEPWHYKKIYRELGESMRRWARVFN